MTSRNGTRPHKRDEPRPCFVVISWEGCWMPEICQAPHVIIDCEVHGMLARVEREDTAEFIMRGHIDTPSWPVPVQPLNAAVLERITASKTRKDRIFVPSTYKG